MRADCKECGEPIVEVMVVEDDTPFSPTRWAWIHVGRVDKLGIPLPVEQQAQHEAEVIT